VALARSIFRKGADFVAAMAFQFASTNLVLELGIIIAVLIGWQFVAAEFVGGLIMVALLTVILRAVMNPHLIEEARQQADRGLAGRMEGHAAMDMSVGGEGSILTRIISRKGFTAISHYFVMDWASVWIDIVLGLLIAGALAAWVPNEFWQAFFLSADPVWSKIVGPLIGPIVAIISFVCSVGNVPLAAVLWNGGISFGGVIAFLFGDLIVLPILDIYRRYYGLKIAATPSGLLRRDGGRGLHCRVDLRDRRAGTAAPIGADRRGSHYMELHYLAQHRFPRLGCAPGMAFPENRWPGNAADDE
jgi:uncharacterized protein